MSLQVCLRLQTCKQKRLRKNVLNCLQSTCGERSSAGRASVCGTEGRGFKSHRSPHLMRAAAMPFRKFSRNILPGNFKRAVIAFLHPLQFPEHCARIESSSPAHGGKVSLAVEKESLRVLSATQRSALPILQRLKKNRDPQIVFRRRQFRSFRHRSAFVRVNLHVHLFPRVHFFSSRRAKSGLRVRN